LLRAGGVWALAAELGLLYAPVVDRLENAAIWLQGIVLFAEFTSEAAVLILRSLRESLDIGLSVIASSHVSRIGDRVEGLNGVGILTSSECAWIPICHTCVTLYWMVSGHIGPLLISSKLWTVGGVVLIDLICIDAISLMIHLLRHLILLIIIIMLILIVIVVVLVGVIDLVVAVGCLMAIVHLLAWRVCVTICPVALVVLVMAEIFLASVGRSCLVMASLGAIGHVLSQLAVAGARAIVR